MSLRHGNTRKSFPNPTATRENGIAETSSKQRYSTIGNSYTNHSFLFDSRKVQLFRIVFLNMGSYRIRTEHALYIIYDGTLLCRRIVADDKECGNFGIDCHFGEGVNEHISSSDYTPT